MKVAIAGPGVCVSLRPDGAMLLEVCVVRYDIKGQDSVTFRLRHNQLALVGICIYIHWHLNKTSVKTFEIRPGKQDIPV